MQRHAPALVLLAIAFALGNLVPINGMLPVAAAEPASVRAPEIDFNLSAQEITNSCDAAIETTRHRFDVILARSPEHVNFANSLQAIEDASADMGDRLVAQQILGSVSSDRTVRDASDRCQDSSSQLFANLTTRPEFARQLRALKAQHASLTRADAKLLEDWNASVERSGAGLPESQRVQVRALFQHIDELETSFGANLANAVPTLTLHANQTSGLPADFLATFQRQANGDYLVPVGESTQARFMSNADDAQARRAFLELFLNRGYPENEKLLQETLAVRLHLAHLLGSPTWADYVLADRMAKNPTKVRLFLDDLDARLLPAARADLERLAALKASATHEPHAQIEPWDVAFYHERYLRRTYAVDDNDVRRYFPVEHTLTAVLGIYAKVLGLAFQEIKPANAWSPDVRQYEVRDAATGAFRGTLYLDLFPRPGKYTHFASFPLLPARRMPSGYIQAPIDAIIGNWSLAQPGQPALLSHNEVETFFHEFGHAMAAILATTPYETLSSGFRTDFVEAPSQMLENWVWNPAILRELSSEVHTGQPMPDALIGRIISARYADEAYFTVRQILFADVDLAYHSADPGVDTTQRWIEIARQVTPLPFMTGTHPDASFGHIMGGYDAGYYGYLWSKVYAQDMFTAFQAGGLESPLVGARYRHDILEPARELEPDQEVRAFLGRPVNAAAFYRDFGLSVPVHSVGDGP